MSRGYNALDPDRILGSSEFGAYKKANIPVTDILLSIIIHGRYPDWVEAGYKADIDQAYDHITRKFGDKPYSLLARYEFVGMLKESTKERAIQEFGKEFVEVSKKKVLNERAKYEAQIAARAANAAHAESAAQASKKRKMNADLLRQVELREQERLRRQAIIDQEHQEMVQQSEQRRLQWQHQPMLQQQKAPETITLQAMTQTDVDGNIKFVPLDGGATPIEIKESDIKTSNSNNSQINIATIGNVIVRHIREDPHPFFENQKRIISIVVEKSPPSSKGGRRRTKRSKRSKRSTRRC
jgi:flagellar biosynthesis GTPase FlhF